MKYHIVNIGKPYKNEWWQRLLTQRMITTGFSGKPGDKGEKILKYIDKGDWIIAYANRYGYVGAGECGGSESYKLIDKKQLPEGYESTHRHQIKVDWKYAVFDLSKGIRTSEVGTRPPRQTRQLVADNISAERVIDALRGRMQADIFSASGEWILPVEFIEGASTRVLVNRYERDPGARNACLLHWGLSCQVCNFNFESMYGALGAGYIHVHHTTPISLYKESHKVDPISELRPVCANCHAMLHQEDPPLSLVELKQKLKNLV